MTTASRSKPTHADGFKRPVAWLFGPRLIASARSMALFGIAGSKLDPRNWMVAKPTSFRDETAPEFWFDYIADSGDGQKAMYSIAYLCLSDLEATGGLTSGSNLAINPAAKSDRTLPRGHFLVVGGDTAYHVATYATLAERFQDPFRWAADDLQINDQSERRHLFGLPGNHDYYDAIDGFNRQFRTPLEPEDKPGVPSTTKAFPGPVLQIPGFKRCQTASYFAIELPFGWSFWGVDNELGDVDIRQQYFFRTLKDRDKLIVATPEPSTVLGLLPDKDHKVSKTFHRLGLPRPFLHEQLAPGHCRLDISGDMHHYARYWGPSTSTKPKAAADERYASVVAGMGGAFLHPSHAAQGDFEEQLIYPSRQQSREATANVLFDVRTVIQGGFVWLLGAIIALIAYLSTMVEDSRRITNPLLAFIAPASTDLGPFGSNMFVKKPAANRAAIEAPATFGFTEPCAALLAMAGLATLAFGIAWVRKQHHLRRHEPPKPGLAGLAALISGAMSVGALTLCPIDGRASLAPALLLVLSLVWSALSLGLAANIAEWLSDLARRIRVSRYDYWPVVLCVTLAVLVPAGTLGTVGRSLSAARLGLDAVILTIWLGVGISLVVIGATLANERAAWRGKLGFALLGTWHAVVQLGLPLVLARLGNASSLVAAALIMTIFAYIGRSLAKGGAWWQRWLLLKAWLAQGFALVLAAILLPAPGRKAIELPGLLEPWMMGTMVAALLGALLSCVSFSWYLAVALAFGGHVNEAGGAARIEDFKQFIRFRLTKDELTGFVIAIDKPEMNGEKLKPRLIDVFTVTPPRVLAPATPVLDRAAEQLVT